jgi:hypothetical protein
MESVPAALRWRDIPNSNLEAAVKNWLGVKNWLRKFGWLKARLALVDARFSPARAMVAGSAATLPLGRPTLRAPGRRSYFSPIGSCQEGTCKG